MGPQRSQATSELGHDRSGVSLQEWGIGKNHGQTKVKTGIHWAFSVRCSPNRMAFLGVR